MDWLTRDPRQRVWPRSKVGHGAIYIRWHKRRDFMKGLVIIRSVKFRLYRRIKQRRAACTPT
jgi:hypothetical protein